MEGGGQAGGGWVNQGGPGSLLGCHGNSSLLWSASPFLPLIFQTDHEASSKEGPSGPLKAASLGTLWSWLKTHGRSNQSILKEISHGISLKGLMLKGKLQHFGHIMRSVDSLEKTLMLGGIGGQEEKGTTEDGT